MPDMPTLMLPATPSRITTQATARLVAAIAATLDPLFAAVGLTRDTSVAPGAYERRGGVVVYLDLLDVRRAMPDGTHRHISGPEMDVLAAYLGACFQVRQHRVTFAVRDGDFIQRVLVIGGGPSSDHGRSGLDAESAWAASITLAEALSNATARMV